MVRRSLLVLALPLLAACAGAETPDTGIDDAAMADETREDWVSYGRTSNERRFSPLTQVDDATVQGLSPDWYVVLPDDKGLVSTPLVVDDVLYFIGSMNIVRAVDATSGEPIWTYDPRVRDYADRMRVGWDHNRGIAFWGDKVYVATWDGRLNAVDADTGTEVWSATTIDPSLPLYITGAPKVFDGKVLVGNGGTEHGPARGYVTAYDAETGEQAWRFWIVPGNPADGFESDAMRMAAETWTGEWWVHGGGGNAWHGFTYDEELNQLYIGTGNGSPWNQKIRSPEGGDNLFLSSIVALDPDTGEYLWHYQDTPGETWDFNSNMDIVLADLEIDGEQRKVILHAPKNGFFYVLDRTDGSLISAEPFTEVTWASHVDPETGRPVENADARYPDGRTVIAPGPLGGHGWHAMSFNQETGLAYFPGIHASYVYDDTNIDHATWRSEPWVGGLGVEGGFGASLREDNVFSTLQAWDPVRQELAWEVPLPGVYSPGTLTTAGNLVFQGRLDGIFAAYRADTGEELWTHDVGLGISAPPITYAVDGKQYVALLVGFGSVMAAVGGAGVAQYGWAYGEHDRMLVAFSLDGAATLPPQPDPVVPIPREESFEVDAELAARGAQVYAKCSWCHGNGAIAAGMTPDLRSSRIITSLERFAGVVRDGERAAEGMPMYPDITLDDLVGLQHYIREQAELALAARREAGG
ncbi:MAG: PQQ-dependent dehydrogenase, methanol/ethanol family [Gemmatimonadota bacterium]|nr:PQQ-dependent dehydrogenase, methanol/ethanol family [Gemmatimonadota bacterium]